MARRMPAHIGRVVTFLRKKEVPKVCIEAVIEKDREQMRWVAEGYAMALNDLSQGLKGVNPGLLSIFVAPAVTQMQAKLRKMQGE